MFEISCVIVYLVSHKPFDINVFVTDSRIFKLLFGMTPFAIQAISFAKKINLFQSVVFYCMLLEKFNQPTESKEDDLISPLRNISFLFPVVSRLEIVEKTETFCSTLRRKTF